MPRQKQEQIETKQDENLEQEQIETKQDEKNDTSATNGKVDIQNKKLANQTTKIIGGLILEFDSDGVVSVSQDVANMLLKCGENFKRKK